MIKVWDVRNILFNDYVEKEITIKNEYYVIYAFKRS